MCPFSNIVRLRTSSKNATVRYFYALISFLLKNVWLCLQKRSFVNRILLFISLQKRLDNCVPSGLVQKHVQTI